MLFLHAVICVLKRGACIIRMGFTMSENSDATRPCCIQSAYIDFCEDLTLFVSFPHVIHGIKLADFSALETIILGFPRLEYIASITARHAPELGSLRSGYCLRYAVKMPTEVIDDNEDLGEWVAWTDGISEEGEH